MTPLPRRSLVFGLALLAGCQSAREAYYNGWEKLGYAKRDRLVDEVKGVKDSQNQAKQQFVSALDQFKQVTHFQGGDLEAEYDKLNDAYTKCSGQADDVRSRITATKHVASALFDEWAGEVKAIQDDDSLQKQSQALYDKSHANFDQLSQRMDAAAASMDPVLTKFHNRVLFIKSNLNAEAIGHLSGTEADLSKDIDALVQQMQASISEADAFIASMSKG